MSPRIAAVLRAVARWGGLATRGLQSLGGARKALTEADWLAGADPTPMLDFLAGRGGAGDRKLRLFACACCRRIWHLLKHPAGRGAVEATERYADGGVAVGEWEAFRGAAYKTMLAHSWTSDDGVHRAAVCAASAGAWEAAVHASTCITLAVMEDRTSSAQEDAAQANLLRCIFGNPFRPVPALAPSVLAWNNGTVPKLAQAIYLERAFDRLPVLADALEDAGCADADILGHCRSGGEHVRGCWAVDLALGKG